MVSYLTENGIVLTKSSTPVLKICFKEIIKEISMLNFLTELKKTLAFTGSVDFKAKINILLYMVRF